MSHHALVSLRTVLIVPGWTNSGPDHWQSHWQRTHPEYQRVEQQNWDVPDVTAWVAELDAAVRAITTPIVFVAHSLGCITVAHWALRSPERTRRITAALLVAPADVERMDAPEVLQTFGPIPMLPLPFPSVVVASTTDPYVPLDRAQGFASAWGSRFVNVGDAGHLNTVAGFGPWHAGEQILVDLLTEISHESSRDV
jgi:predicted alpha/beta hydrolase family esterase